MCQGAAISRNKSEPGEQMHPPPCLSPKQALGDQQIEEDRHAREHQRNEPFDQHANCQRSGHDRGPQQGSRLLFVLRPKEGPQSEGDHERQHHVRNNNAREQEQPDASGDDETGIDSGLPADRPSAEAHDQPGEKNRRECRRDARDPVMHAEQVIQNDRHPILERALCRNTERHPSGRSPNRPSGTCCWPSAPGTHPHRP